MRQFLSLFLVVLFSAGAASAQNKVLELDGFGSYVELPPDIFTNLTEATVEAWAKWDSFRGFSRIFEFGAGYQSMSLFNHGTTPDVRFNLYPRNARQDPSSLYFVRVNGLLELHEWVHLAAVSGPGGMKLYVNGVLMGEHTNAASFADIKVTQTNYFGRGLVNNRTDQDFRGQIDEIRVWNHRRTEAQIRENMSKRLTGKEAGLAGLWNFDDGTANDSSPNVHHGNLQGNARLVAAEWPLVSPRTPPPSLSPNTNVPPPQLAANASGTGFGAAIWAIAGALILITALLAWLGLMLRRSAAAAPRLLPKSPARALLTDGGGASVEADAAARAELKQRALAELTDFAKESLVQGLYSQRQALLKAQQSAQQELAELESRLSALHLPDRVHAYQKRIAELEAKLETRDDEMRELTTATLLLLRQKLEEEKQHVHERSRFN
jgi:concanavalin A-like lectin/glucanase superfamily protein